MQKSCQRHPRSNWTRGLQAGRVPNQAPTTTTNQISARRSLIRLPLPNKGAPKEPTHLQIGTARNITGQDHRNHKSIRPKNSTRDKTTVPKRGGTTGDTLPNRTFWNGSSNREPGNCPPQTNRQTYSSIAHGLCGCQLHCSNCTLRSLAIHQNDDRP